MKIKEIKMLQKMSIHKQLTFAYLSCERMFNYYEYSSKKCQYGDPAALSDALEFIREHIFTPPCYSDLEYFMEKVCINQPDVHNNYKKWNAIGLSVCGIFRETLEFLYTNRKSALKAASDYCIEIIRELTSVRAIAEESQCPDITYTNYHPKILKEVMVQKSIIKYLQRIGEMDCVDIQDLRLLQGGIIV